MTKTSKTMITTAHTGYQGSQRKFTTALSTAMMTPTVLAQTAPKNSNAVR